MTSQGCLPSWSTPQPDVRQRGKERQVRVMRAVLTLPQAAGLRFEPDSRPADELSQEGRQLCDDVLRNL
jgi:hypothetical protein